MTEPPLAATLRLDLHAPPRPGWPKVKPCLVCGRLRVATAPNDRLHPTCRARAVEDETGALVAAGLLRWSGEGGE
ncbi:MAG: hypothetical protein HY553_16715 [Elusimicrobia bacterium]|nr:hypothetical protein [Elusimicrobiota bacterium]